MALARGEFEMTRNSAAALLMFACATGAKTLASIRIAAIRLSEKYWRVFAATVINLDLFIGLTGKSLQTYRATSEAQGLHVLNIQVLKLPAKRGFWHIKFAGCASFVSIKLLECAGNSNAL